LVKQYQLVWFFFYVRTISDRQSSLTLHDFEEGGILAWQKVPLNGLTTKKGMVSLQVNKAPICLFITVPFQGDGYKSLNEGDTVEYELGQGQKVPKLPMSL